MTIPKKHQFVELINNKTGEVVARGNILYYSKENIKISGYKGFFDAKIHHFKGYEPKHKLKERNRTKIRNRNI